MKYSIKIGDQTYQVEILDLEQRPVVALVDGQPVEVWPIEERKEIKAQTPARQDFKSSTSAQNISPAGTSIPASRAADKALRAPLPGVIQAVNVKPGDTVSAGQELFVIEAMKMRNAIRSSRSGRIAALHVAAGQTVNHNDLLLEFDEPGDQG